MSDEVHSDLLSHLPTCVNFIHDALLQHGCVLVHCRQGVSRSAAAVTGYLMNRDNLGRDSALGMVRRARPGVEPNGGFMDQLQLFEKMGGRVETTDWRYQLYRLEVGYWEEEEVAAGGRVSCYKCRKCRVVVAEQRHVLPHFTRGSPDWKNFRFDWVDT